jgi:excisionase family DNA binding protein
VAKMKKDSADAAAVCSPKRAFSIAEFSYRYAIGRTTTYEEIKAGRLKVLKVGRRSLITETDAEGWLAALPRLEEK